MRAVETGAWDVSVHEAVAIQRSLRSRLITEDDPPGLRDRLRVVAGVVMRRTLLCAPWRAEPGT